MRAARRPAGAERWFRASAEAGDTAGMLNLARVLKPRGEVAEAAMWLARASGADVSAPTPAAAHPLNARSRGQ